MGLLSLSLSLSLSRTQESRIMGLSKVISTLIGVISRYQYSFLTYNPSY